MYNVKLKDGSHSVTVTIRDGFGNETSETRNFVVDTSESVGDTTVRVVPDGDPMLGGTLDLQIIASDANVVENTTGFKLGNQFKDYDVKFSDNYVGTTSYSRLTKTIIVKATRKAEAAAEDGNVIATLSVKIPADLLEGDNFTYTVKSGKFETANGAYDTYSTNENKLPIKSEYFVSADPIIIGGSDGVIKVTDSEGKPAEGVTIYLVSEDSAVGKTDENGQLVTDQFNETAAETAVYAKDDAGMLSFQYKLYSYNPQGDLAGLPHCVRFNAVSDSTTQKNITWLSNPLVEGRQILKYAVSGTDSWTTAEADIQQVEFGSNGYNVVNVNSTLITGLNPDTTYEYVIGTEKNTSEAKTFKTDSKERTNSSFFILGDIQDPDKTYLQGIVDKLKGNQYNFGVQIGDAIDQAADYDDWAALGEIVGARMLGDTDIISVMGNHEYYGDSDASIASAMYNNPKTEAGTCYSRQYGNIYMAVINFGENSTQIKAAAEWLKNDAAKSDAVWKVLFSHQPPYFTNSVGGNDPVYKYIPDACEAAGIDVVFSGHDHSFARTNPLIKDKVDEENGIVYYVSGAVGSKRYPVSTQDKFNYKTIFNYLSERFTATYLTVDSDKEEMTVNMYEYGNESPVNTLVIQSECKKNGHSTVYDPKNEQVKCTVCGDVIEGYTGDIKDADGNEYNLLNGKKQTGWVTVGEDIRYYSNTGIREKVITEELPSTCIIDGYIIYTSESGEAKRVDYNDAGGHEYEKHADGTFVCSKCGWQRVEMKDLKVSLSYDKCTYTGIGKTPATTAVNPVTGDTLKKVNPYRDYYSKYTNNVEVGTASVTLTAAKYGVYVDMTDWRGNYKGTVTMNYTIHPDVPKNAYVGLKGTEAELAWDAVDNAVEYVIQQYTKVSGWKEIATVSAKDYNGSVNNRTYTVKNLNADTYYSFRIGTVAIGKDAEGDNAVYRSLKYTVATDITPEITSAVSVNDGKPVLKWKGVEGATYTVYKKDGAAGKYAVAGTTESTSFRDTSAVAGNTYYYKVRITYGEEKAVASADSNVVKAVAKCAKPEVASSHRVIDGKPRLTWKSVAGAEKYEIYRSTTGKTGTFTKQYTTTYKSYTNSSAVANKAYYYKVRAIDKNGGKGEFAAAVKVTCLDVKPVVKTGNRTTDGKPTLSWEKMKGASGYEVYRSTSGKAKTYYKVFTTKGTLYIHTSAASGKTYYYKVRAVSDTGVKGVFSNVVKNSAK